MLASINFFPLLLYKIDTENDGIANATKRGIVLPSPYDKTLGQFVVVVTSWDADASVAAVEHVHYRLGSRFAGNTSETDFTRTVHTT
jgi:hypothetical protein